MSVFVKLYQVISQIMNTPFNIYGYNITFMNIFAFVMIGCICAIFLRRLFS